MAVCALVRGETREHAPRLLRREERRRSETRDREQGDPCPPPDAACRDLRFHAVGTVFAGSFCAIATASGKLISRGTTIDTARARCAAGARPGGAAPRATALAASMSRRRVCTMPVSEE